MARRAEPSTFVHFDFKNITQLILAASNVVRWKPALAIEWMREAEIRVGNLVESRTYNYAVREINKTLATIERAPYYKRDQDYIWRITKPGVPDPTPSSQVLGIAIPTRLEEIDETPTLEEHIQMELAKNETKKAS